MGIRPRAEPAYQGPRGERHDHERARHPAVLALALPAVVLLAVVAGTGWLYLLRQAGALAVGPLVPGSLELEHLAAADAQPLLRLAVAWLPAGLVAGACLRPLVPRRRALAAALAAGVLALVLLLAVGAVSDAIENSQPVARHVGEQLGRGGPWVAAGLVLIGAYPGVRVRAARRGGAAPASSAR